MTEMSVCLSAPGNHNDKNDGSKADCSIDEPGKSVVDCREGNETFFPSFQSIYLHPRREDKAAGLVLVK